MCSTTENSESNQILDTYLYVEVIVMNVISLSPTEYEYYINRYGYIL